jgi:hypothetical protein
MHRLRLIGGICAYKSDQITSAHDFFEKTGEPNIFIIPRPSTDSRLQPIAYPTRDVSDPVLTTP